MEEIWKDAVGYEGVYKVSNLGRVMSVNYRHTGKPKILSATKRKGYYSIHRRSYGKREMVHRLVAVAFIPNPNNYPCVNHINEDKTDNRACNLEWCDHQYNNTYGRRLEKMAQTRLARKEKTHRGCVLQYSITGDYIAKYPTTVAASLSTNVDRTGINRCALGYVKTSGGFVWKYE